jgi:hypothetical protein
MNTAAELLASDLQRVLEGAMRLEDVLEDPRHVHGRPLAACFHGLQHFLMDEDFRAKDPEYRKMQEDEMRKLIRLLETEADEETLRCIHFLGRTHV